MNNKLHTPIGTADILESQYQIKENVTAVLKQCFTEYGYSMVQTPMYEYADVFLYEESDTTSEKLIKFVDNEGYLLTLRPDFTPQIARMAATSLINRELPLKISYLGQTFRNDEAYGGFKQREFTQAGIELMGIADETADIETITLTIDALRKCGVQDFKIDIGHVGYFKGLIADLRLSQEQAEQLRDLIDFKNFAAIGEFVAKHGLQGSETEALCALPELFGGIEVIEKAMALSGQDNAALMNLKKITDLLCKKGYSNFITIDLGLLPNLNYYTGVVFKGICAGQGFPLCSGGRYDKLLCRFGRDMAAVGVAINVDRIVGAI